MLSSASSASVVDSPRLLWLSGYAVDSVRVVLCCVLASVTTARDAPDAAGWRSLVGISACSGMAHGAMCVAPTGGTYTSVLCVLCVLYTSVKGDMTMVLPDMVSLRASRDGWRSIDAGPQAGSVMRAIAWPGALAMPAAAAAAMSVCAPWCSASAGGRPAGGCRCCDAAAAAVSAAEAAVSSVSGTLGSLGS